MKYNHLNLPTEVTFATGKINYTYDAAGTRLVKKVQPSGGTVVTTDYVNDFQYENNVLQFFSHAEGYVKANGNSYLYAYQYKDHLGNVRLSYADINGNGTIEPATEILEENNYYPFGLLHKGYNEIANTNRSEAAERYKFNGMEWQPELGLNAYDFGARNYDPALGRWMNIDPLAEASRRWTPYNYAYNNPIYFIDPDGMQATTVQDAVKENLTFNNGYTDINMSEFGGAADHSGFYSNTGYKGSSYQDPPGKAQNNRGDKVLHIKYQGRDESVYENDNNIIAEGYRRMKSMKEKLDELLSGGFHFYDSNNPAGSGGQDQGKQWKAKNKDEKLDSFDASTALQAASFATRGEGIGSIKSVTAPIMVVNNILSGMSLGHSTVEPTKDLAKSINDWLHKPTNDSGSTPAKLPPGQNIKLRDYRYINGQLKDSLYKVHTINSYK